MKSLKYTLFFFFAVDIAIFVSSQVDADLLVSLLPQFDIESAEGAYPRLVGVLFLMLGLARLYGGLYIQDKGAFIASMWSWVVELVYTISEIAHGQFVIIENVVALIVAPLMLAWSFLFYRKNFLPEQQAR